MNPAQKKSRSHLDGVAGFEDALSSRMLSEMPDPSTHLRYPPSVGASTIRWQQTTLATRRTVRGGKEVSGRQTRGKRSLSPLGSAGSAGDGRRGSPATQCRERIQAIPGNAEPCIPVAFSFGQPNCSSTGPGVVPSPAWGSSRITTIDQTALRRKGRMPERDGVWTERDFRAESALPGLVIETAVFDPGPTPNPLNPGVSARWAGATAERARRRLGWAATLAAAAAWATAR